MHFPHAATCNTSCVDKVSFFGQKPQKNAKKGVFTPKKRKRGGGYQMFQSKIDHYHRNQRPKKLAHQILTVSFQNRKSGLLPLYPEVWY